MSKWIKKGDKVVVIAGNDKGKTGESSPGKMKKVCCCKALTFEKSMSNERLKLQALEL